MVILLALMKLECRSVSFRTTAENVKIHGVCNWIALRVMVRSSIFRHKAHKVHNHCSLLVIVVNVNPKGKALVV